MSIFGVAIPALTIICLCYAVSVAHQAKSVNNSAELLDGPAIGSSAPDFTLPNVNGKSTTLSSFRGHNEVLAFFCGCDRCEKAGKEIAKLQRQGRIKHFVAVVGLVPGAASQFQKDCGFQGIVLSDQSEEVMDKYASSFCPRLWMISDDGRLIYKSELAVEGAKLRNTLRVVKAL